MIARRTQTELDKMRHSGQVLHEILARVQAAVRPGATTWDLEAVADAVLRELGATSAFRGYHGYPCVLCVSVNEQVIHGIPSRKRTLQEGDLVSLDCGVVVNGYYADHAVSLLVASESNDLAPRLQLLEVTRAALAAGIDQARAGNHLGDISQAVQRHAEAAGYGIVREFVGHGIGTHLHEDPQVPNFGTAGSGPKLREGMVLAIEPMFNLGAPGVEVLADGWTAVTSDGQPSAHFEHTVAVTGNGPWVLTGV
ncbi:MAG: type I methionyl aminopeptidase [Terriglobales bacterium]